MRKKLGMGVLFVIGFALCCLPIIWNVIEQRHQSDAVATYQNAVSKKDDTKLKEIMENARACVVEFVVKKSTWYPSHANPGTAGCHPEWNSRVVRAVNTGYNYLQQ